MNPTPRPILGSGLGYRAGLHERTMASTAHIDWLELLAEHFLPLTPWRRDLLHELRAAYVCVPHCLNLSVGGVGEVDESYLAALREISGLIDAPWVSDHLCFTEGDGLDFGHLTPLPWTRRTADRAADKAAYIQRRLGRPFLLENITYHFRLGGELTEAQFIERVLTRADCGMLLDLNNVYTNAVNHGFDAVAFLDQLPLDRVVQLHVAGGRWHGAVLEDSHDAPVPDEVWRLVEHIMPRATSLRAVLLERDAEFPAEFEVLLGEIARARDLLAGRDVERRRVAG
jgi:uncharacterized protein (UPF0276 family)